MSTNQINQFPLEAITSEHISRQGSCTVCMEQFVEGESSVRVLPCGHFFHEQCLANWIVTSATCPTCRFTLPSTELGVEEEHFPAPIMLLHHVVISFQEPTSSIFETRHSTPSSSRSRSERRFARDRSRSLRRNRARSRRRSRSRARRAQQQLNSESD